MNNEEKRQLLMKMLSKKKEEGGGEISDRIVRSGKTKFPLSNIQRGIWVDCQLDPDSVVYNIPFACKINGDLDIDILKESLKRIIERHDVWRSVIRQEDGDVFQEVLADTALDFSFFDYRKKDAGDAFIAEEAKGFVRRHIDLENGPLVRFALYQTGDETFYFILSGHHIVYDGSSENIFSRELSLEYASILNKQESSVKAPEISYGDYAEYSLAALDSAGMNAQINYWKDELTGREPVEFPTDRVRPAVRLDDGGMIYFDIDPSVEQRVREYAALHHCTVNVVLFAGISCLLYTYTGNESIVIGTTVANRDNEQLEDLLGCFINNLVITADITSVMSFDEIVSGVREKLFKAYGNKDVPLETLVKEINPPRDLSRTPFYEVGFNYNPRTRMELSLVGCECEEFKLGDHVTLTDVNFQIHDDGHSLCGFVEYNSSIYDRETISGIVKNYEILLKNFIENSAKQIITTEIISEEEKQLIITQFNDTKVDYPKDKTIVELFEEQAEKTPDNIAVVFEEQQLTYAQLNEKANRLAYRLRELGVKPDDFVALFTERSLEMIVGIYGIIKAGGAYVPIDPTYPEDRILFMLEDAAPKAVLTYKSEIETDIPVIDLAESEVWESAPQNPKRVNKPEDLLYCIYTSGTTGKPKGVMIKHQNVVNYSIVSDKSTMAYAYEKKLTRFVSVTNMTFDIFVTEVILTLCNGMTAYIANKEQQNDLEQFEKLVKDHEIEILQTTPSRIKGLFAQNPDTQVFSGLKYIMLGGEAVGADVVRKLKETSDAVVENVYGPSETTVWSSCLRIEEEYQNIPVGKPISNTQIYIVKGDTLCGIGVPGELCIAGDGLARGYLNRPELTEEKFVKNPFGEGRMYHTGDLARWLPDGNIEYLGRIDDQVKIRGFRIELGEIESRIREINEVKDCAVIARTDANGDKEIYAYVVGDEEISIAGIRETLSASLPDYMIPSYMMQIESIPVNKSGKLDRRALPDIEAKTGNEYVAPRNETEEIICSIFSEILSVEQVSVKDSFFELGGHSLRATRLVNRIEAETGHRIALKQVFGSPTPEKLALFVTGAPQEEYMSIPCAEEKEYYPMSSAQKRTFLICQMDPDGILYNMSQNLRLRGEVSADALGEAVQKMMDRHEILRTEFLMVDGEPVQKILAQVEADFTYVKDCETPEEELISNFIRPFDLCKAPLVRVRLVDRGEYHLLSIDIHHIIADGMSIGTFIRELNAFYNGEELEELTHQFKDYSEWMETRDLSNQAGYWKSQFEDEIPVLDMPYDYLRPQEQSYKGAMVYKTTGKALCEKIKALSAKAGATEFMVFLSAAMVLLGKYSRQEDIVIGTPISGRTHKDTEDMLGMFVNTLAMRGKPEGKKTYLAFLQEIKEMSLKAYENQEYPFEELVEAVEVQRDLSRNPLFDVMMVLQNNEDEVLRFKGAKAEWAETEDKVAKFDLTFDIGEYDGEFGIGLEYCTDLFKEESARHILEHFMTVLEKLTEEPTARIESIEAVSEEEKQLIINQFNDTKVDYPKDKTIVELFEEQAEKTPDNIAVVFEEQQLTYAQLNEKANRLAYRLRELGVKPDDFVALFTERSLEMIVGIYGIIKAGGAYVPIDPAYPEERKKYMLEDCAPKAVVVYGAEIETDIAVIDLAESEAWESAPQNPKRVNKPEDLLYCIYTSGTTGKPKGVLLEHRNVSNLASYMRNVLGVTEKDRVMLFANYIFDGSVWEMLSALMNGASLNIPTDETIRDIAAMQKYVLEKKITVSYFPPSYYEQGRFALDHYVITAGSAASMSVVESVLENSGYINSYGPTEATVCISNWICEKGEKPERISIGKPISNVEVYIMQGEKLCGIGVPGELCVSGVGISRGYLNNPELTEEKFVKNPFGEGRMYHTGDLARWLPDGNIEYLGRIDEQVKIRGFRVELGEIESRIREIEAVKDCAVIAKEDASEEKAIYAYVVGDEEISMAGIREVLSASLPDYMIPSYMMQIESIPVTRNGKVDRRALPDITAKSGREYKAPTTETEKKICDIYEEVLKTEQVGIEDDFFSLGGHSLKATYLVNKMEEVFGIRIPLKEIFKNATPFKLASVIEGKLVDNAESEIEQIGKAEEKEEYTMSSMQKRIFLINQLENGGITYNMPSAYEVSGKLDYAKVQVCFEKMLARHEILRTQLLIKDDELIQRVCYEVEADVEELDFCGKSEEDIEKAYDAFVRPFDLGKPPLVRMALGHKDNNDILFIDMHHVVSDGNSYNTFLREFACLYNGEKLEEPDLQYKDYSEWLKEKDFAEQEKYWVNQFNDEIPVLNMPTDYARPIEQSFKGDAYWREIDEKTREKVKELCKQTGTTEYMVMLACIMITLSKYSHQEDIVIGSPISGRTHVSVENMLGMFINTLAMRGKPNGEKTFAAFLQEVRGIALKAYENQEYPFEKLVEAVEIKRDISRNPIFDVLFTFQNMEETKMELGGMKTTCLPIGHHNIAKFDLNFSIGEDGDRYSMGLEYCTDLFTREKVVSIVNHFIHILTQIMDNPSVLIKDIELITPEEKTAILESVHHPAGDMSNVKCVHTLFEEQVQRMPKSVAACYEGEKVTYEELNAKANRLANYLRNKGLGFEEKVAVFIDKSIDALVTLLGIMKAGGVYVPIDTHYPAERVMSIVQKSESRLFLTTPEFSEDVPPFDGIDIINIKSEENNINSQSDANLNLNISAEQLMYIIFTSGSTGVPKGVMVRHRNYYYYLNGIIKLLHVQEPMNFALVSTFAADLGSTNIYVPLMTGGCVHLISYERSTDPDALAQYFSDNRIDAMKLVPSHFSALQALENPEIVVPHKKIILAGEACRYDVVKKIRQQNPECEIYNNYGPTETTVSVLGYKVLDIEKAQDTVVPLGKPIEGVSTYVLDENMKLLPPGVDGELYIGGPTVSAGYIGDSELNEKAFIKNPFDDNDPYPLYRTGDKVRLLSDGNIEIFGRMDRQIKIRGYRIDPEGIEEVICRQEDVRNAVVMTVKDKQKDQRLVAYLVPVIKGNTVDIASLRSNLKTVLPDYMIPSAFMCIDVLPITANGKLDYGKLPDITNVSMESDIEYEAPRNKTEEKIVSVFEEILGVEKVGIDDNFFDLGGESFKSIKAARRIDPNLNVIQLFKYPTPRQLAEYLSKNDPKKAEGILYELTPSDGKEKRVNFICIPYGGGNAITYQPLANELPKEYGLFAVQVPGHDYKSADPDPRPLDEVAEKCLQEIKEKVNGPIAIYGQCVGGALAIKLAMMLEENHMDLLGVFEAAHFPFPRLPGKIFELWNKLFPTNSLTSNRLYKESLKMIGGGDESEDEEELQYMLKGMRHDVKEAEDFYTKILNYTPDFEKLNAPICCVVGEKDRSTTFYQERYKEWEDFSDNITVKSIPLAGHFFHKHQSKDLAQTLISQSVEWENSRNTKAAVEKQNQVDKPLIKKNSLRALRENPKPNLKIMLIVAIGQIISILGSSMSSYALGIWAMGESVNLVPYRNITILIVLANVLTAPFAGPIVDRFDRRKVMIISDCVAAIGTVLIAGMFFFGEISMWQIYLATILSSLASAFQRPAYLAGIAQIAPKRYLGQMNGLVQLGESASTFIAPMLGGVMLLFTGLKGVLIIDFITFLVSIGTLFMIRFPNCMFQKQEEGFAKEILGGWKYIAKRKSMRSMVLFFLIVNFLGSAASFLQEPILLGFTDAGTMGVIVGMQSAGMIIGALIISIWGGFERRAKGMVGFVIVSGLTFVVFGLRPSVWITALGSFGVGVTMALVNSHWQILIQTKVGMELQGRVFSINMMLVSLLNPVSVYFAGLFSESYAKPFMEGTGVAASLAKGIVGTGTGREMALLCVLFGLAMFVWGLIGTRWKSLINMEDLLPDAVPGAVIYEDKDKIQEQMDNAL